MTIRKEINKGINNGPIEDNRRCRKRRSKRRTMRESSQGNQRNVHRTERRFGSFQRSLTLPNTVKADEITASLEHGVLTLNIPKAESVKPRQISISAGGKGEQKSLEVGR
mgnify:CR=1 FL=1